MAIVCRYPNYVFVSYAHIDNEPLATLDKGWVTEFRNALELRLKVVRPASSVGRTIKCGSERTSTML